MFGWNTNVLASSSTGLCKNDSLMLQEQLIEKRKKEVEAKLSQKPQIVKDVPENVPQVDKNAENKFANDGSFFQQFLKMQKRTNNLVATESGEFSFSHDSEDDQQNKNTGALKKPLLIGKRPGLGSGSLSTMLHQMKQTGGSAANSRAPLVTRPSIFTLDDEEENEETGDEIDKIRNSSVSPPEDGDTCNAVEKLAMLVAEAGPEFEKVAVENNRNDKAFWFLYDQSSEAYKYFQQKVKENLARKEHGATRVHSITNPARTSFPSTFLGPFTQSQETSSTTYESLKRKRKSRWAPESEITPLPSPILIHGPVNPYQDNSNVQTPALNLHDLGYSKGKPAGLVGVTELSEDQKKQLKEQQEMQQMYNMIMAHKRAMAEIQILWEKEAAKHQHGYDSDEELDPHMGTWEHRLRHLEMEKTREWAEKLTDMNRGKHFIGDFLPPDELDKFMETFKALKEGRDPDYSDYKDFKLTVENIGYKMLMKMGWAEGQGLGSDGQGIKNPVNKGTQAVDGAGFGIDRPDELSKEDDEYDAFRKRMMLAYRFRPNPLNNPRRPYY
uniref:SURP and G-patch domain-containing protein 1 isoform X2 n=1 Tax=Myxine glutinosa TaxID=7769 RepID=UPI00358E397D